jgi:hypothetical protein
MFFTVGRDIRISRTASSFFFSVVSHSFAITFVGSFLAAYLPTLGIFCSVCFTMILFRALVVQLSGPLTIAMLSTIAEALAGSFLVTSMTGLIVTLVMGFVTVLTIDFEPAFVLTRAVPAERVAGAAGLELELGHGFLCTEVGELVKGRRAGGFLRGAETPFSGAEAVLA